MPRKQHCQAKTASAALSDQQLVAGIRESSEEHFNILYERYFQRVYGFVYSRLRNRADAEEVVQETFTAVHRSIDAYRGRSSLVSWIYGIARNTVNNHVRRAKVQELRLERAEEELQRSAHSLASCTPEEHLNLRRSAEAIRQRLSSVADWHAEAFALRHMDNLPIDEIARRMSRSNDAVRSSLYRMKRLLTEAVESGGAIAE